MFTKHHFGMLGKILIDPDRFVILRRGADLGEVQPSAATGSSPLQRRKKRISTTRRSQHRRKLPPAGDRSGKVRHRGDVLACRSIRLVHGAGGGDESGETAGLEAIDRLAMK
jgi:hypothetical protein